MKQNISEYFYLIQRQKNVACVVYIYTEVSTFLTRYNYCDNFFPMSFCFCRAFDIFEAWAKWAQKMVNVCAIGIHLEPIN